MRLLPLNLYCFFFFQAEDGIRDYKVTGVQTCALPIFGFCALPRSSRTTRRAWPATSRSSSTRTGSPGGASSLRMRSLPVPAALGPKRANATASRSVDLPAPLGPTTARTPSGDSTSVARWRRKCCSRRRTTLMQPTPSSDPQNAQRTQNRFLCALRTLWMGKPCSCAASRREDGARQRDDGLAVRAGHRRLRREGVELGDEAAERGGPRGGGGVAGELGPQVEVEDVPGGVLDGAAVEAAAQLGGDAVDAQAGDAAVGGAGQRLAGGGDDGASVQPLGVEDGKVRVGPDGQGDEADVGPRRAGCEGDLEEALLLAGLGHADAVRRAAVPGVRRGLPDAVEVAERDVVERREPRGLQAELVELGLRQVGERGDGAVDDEEVD